MPKSLFPRRFRASGQPRASPGLRPAGFERKLAIEVLEPRWLLSLTNVVMDQTQKDAITGGLTGLADWATTLDQHGIAKQVLPVIGRSVGDALGIGDILGQGLAAADCRLSADGQQPDDRRARGRAAKRFWARPSTTFSSMWPMSRAG